MIRRTIRLGIRLGLLAGIGLGLFKLLQGRRSASEAGSPSADWAPPPIPNPNLPKAPPEPELVKPVMLEELIEKKAAAQDAPPEVTIEPPPSPTVAPLIREPASGKAAPARQAAVKKAPAPPAGPPAAAGPVKKVAPKKPAAQKAAPAKKAPKKQLP